MLNHVDKKYTCENCSVQFNRSDCLKRHARKCKQKTDNICDICNKVLSVKSGMKRHRKRCQERQLKIDMKKTTQEYNKKLEKGAMIEKILRTCPDIREEALDRNKRHCLKLYQSTQQVKMNTDDIILKPWQKQVLSFVEKPSERTIYWIRGSTGNEGKTFIQKYIYGVYGSRRVIKSEVNLKKADIAYTFTQESLTCKDIFLFNLLRSDEHVSYGFLENIKDGYMISSKYGSKELQIQTPNTVIVFSNHLPIIDNLSDDRWEVYNIQWDGQLSKEKIQTIRDYNARQRLINYSSRFQSGGTNFNKKKY